MRTPEKIYLQVCGDCPQTDCEDCKFEDLESNITWCKERIFPKDVEYTSTDALVKQMKAWLMDNSANYMMYDPLTSSACLEVEKMIEDFRKYIKGE